MTAFPVGTLREQFPALRRTQDGRPVVYLDGPAGTQVPQRVIDAMAEYLSVRNANHGGVFATSRETDQMLTDAREAVAQLLGADDGDEIVFGQNMTSLTFHVSRTLAAAWRPGDEIVVTNLDHDANVTPWVLAAAERGATVRRFDIREDDCTLDVEQFRGLLNERTKFVAVGLAANAVGTVNPVAEIARMAKRVGATVFVDAVHAVPHLPVDVRELGVDFLACSAYKFFGPHQGILWGKRELLEALRPPKLRPVADAVPDRWMTGTQSHEGIAGVLAAVQYLAEIAGLGGKLRHDSLQAAMNAIRDYERGLSERFLAGIAELPQYRLFGIADRGRLAERVPTFSLVHRDRTSRELAAMLAEAGIFAWHGNFYALPLTERLGLEPHGMLRIGFVHYNTAEEVDRLLRELARR